MTVPKPTDLASPIERHLLGRRAEGRVELRYVVECQGARGRHDGELLDLSRNGALMMLLDARFQARDELDLIAIAERLNEEFGHRMTVRFDARAVVVNARLVRAARDATSGRTLLACAFDRPLSTRECRLLRLGPAYKNQVP